MVSWSVKNIRNPAPCEGDEPLAVSMDRGRAGLTSTSNLAASGEFSQARILAAMANSPGAAALEQFRAAGSSSERFLVLNGASSTGKTMWARCFSAHPELMQWFTGDTVGFLLISCDFARFQVIAYYAV